MNRIVASLCALVLASCVTTQATPPPPEPAPTPSEPPPAQPNPPPASGERVPAVSPDHPQYQRVEATSFNNACQSDDQCFTGGCSSEMCSAEQGATSTCEMPADGWPTGGASCGCVAGQCQWYTGPGSQDASSDGGGSTALPGVGQPCPDGACAGALTCMRYYGIAGASGPTFTSCETPCGKGDSCPEGQSCVTIADGPGRVCRSQ